MARRPSSPVESVDPIPSKVAGSQTLQRGLDLIETIGDGITDISDIAQHLGLTRSTAYRLAATLVERRYLALTPRSAYRLGPKLLDLGALAHRQTSLIQVARPTLEELAERTLDTVHLGVLDGGHALYLDKIPGGRRIDISSRVGERQPLHSTGLGKALLLDGSPSAWDGVLDEEGIADPQQRAAWHARMANYKAAGRSFDLEENEDRIRCVAAPIRDSSGRIVAAISLSSATQYMDDDRMSELSDDVRAAARAISGDLGWADRGEDRAPQIASDVVGKARTGRAPARRKR